MRNKVPLFALSLLVFSAGSYAQAPNWVNNLPTVYPDREWVAVIAQGNSQPQAESAAMNALARIFRTDVSSLTQASQQFSQVINNAAGIRSVNFDQSQNYSQDVITSTNVRGLIGVQIEVYRAQDRTVYVNARMNRRECSVRYSGMINENAAIINMLLTSANSQGTFDTYAKLSFAHAIAQVTDSFQNILEVLDTSAVNRRHSYGGANSIRALMMECASLITIGIVMDTEEAEERTIFTRAAGSFFSARGFRINEQGQGNYILRANVRFEVQNQSVISCRYYMDSVLEGQNRSAVFSFTHNDRWAHPNNHSEARRLAVRAVETSIKEGRFAQEFEAWLHTFLD